MAKSPGESPTRHAKIHDQKVQLGNGGEFHQIASDDQQVMTTAHGVPISDDYNSLKAGSRGPTLVEDFHFREKIFHFDHERIPERVVHARGYGAHGFFETYKPLSRYTRADLFQRAGEKTPAFVRFSTVAGSKGSADLARDVRGFAVKIYTKEGNWDLVGNNIPVFFIQDALRFPDLVHSVKEEPDSGFPQAQSAHDNFWDFISLTPESMHMIMWVMSDRGIPRSFRFMEGFGVHTFRFLNSKDESTFVKFHWKPKLGLQSVLWNEALKINGADPDFHRRDLWNAIKAGNYPEWELCVQLFDQEFADKFEFDVLDPTKLIPEEAIKPVPIGRLVLDRMPDNFFAETEQVAFMTQNVPPGIDFSNDPLLQGRNFSYLDTQLKRLGSTNFTHIPINAPKCPFAHFQQDGHMATRNPVGRVNYQPNSFDTSPRESPQRGFRSFAEVQDGPKVRLRAESFADHYSQARQFYISQQPLEQQHIAEALTFELSKVKTPIIRERVVSHLLNIDDDLANNVATGLGITKLPKPADAAVKTNKSLKASPALSILAKGPESFEGRKLGIVITDGTDGKLLKALQNAVTEVGGACEIIALKVSGATSADGKLVVADEQINGAPSVVYDAVALLPSADGIKQLVPEATAQDFVTDAFAHCKFIGYTSATTALFDKVGLSKSLDDGVIELTSAADAKAFVKKLGKLRVWAREPKVKKPS